MMMVNKGKKEKRSERKQQQSNRFEDDKIDSEFRGSSERNLRICNRDSCCSDIADRA